MAIVYYKRKQSAAVAVKICEVFPSVLGVRRLEFTHFQKENGMALVLLNKLSQLQTDSPELKSLLRTVSTRTYETYLNCIQTAQSLIRKFTTLNTNLSYPYEKELESISHYLSAFPGSENYSQELDEEVLDTLNEFNRHKSSISHLENAIITLAAEVEVFKQEYENYLQMLQLDKDKSR